MVTVLWSNLKVIRKGKSEQVPARTYSSPETSAATSFSTVNDTNTNIIIIIIHNKQLQRATNCLCKCILQHLVDHYPTHPPTSARTSSWVPSRGSSAILRINGIKTVSHIFYEEMDVAQSLGVFFPIHFHNAGVWTMYVTVLFVTGSAWWGSSLVTRDNRC